MNTNLWQVGGKDVLRGAINAILIAVLVGLAGIVAQPGFDVFNADLWEVLHLMINWGVISFVSYMGAMFTSDKNGRFAGRV